MGKTCIICGKETGAKWKICDDCIDRLNEKIHHPEPGICPICGKNVVHNGKKNNSKYCSPDCYNISIKVNQKIWHIGHRKRLPQDIVPRQAPQKRTVKRKSRLDENALKAREMGLSYGIYMSRVRSGNA